MTQEKKDKIIFRVAFCITIFFIMLFWNIFDADNEDIVKTFENQIIVVEDNNMADILKNVSLETVTVDNSEEEHTFIHTYEDLSIIELKGRYDREGDIILLDYSNNRVGPKIGAILLGLLAGFIIGFVGIGLILYDIL